MAVESEVSEETTPQEPARPEPSVELKALSLMLLLRPDKLTVGDILRMLELAEKEGFNVEED